VQVFPLGLGAQGYCSSSAMPYHCSRPPEWPGSTRSEDYMPDREKPTSPEGPWSQGVAGQQSTIRQADPTYGKPAERHAESDVQEAEEHSRRHEGRVADIQRLTTLLPLLGVGLYGALRFGQQLFCNRLDVTPEEIGLTQSATIARAAVVVVILLSFFALPTAALFLFGDVIGKIDRIMVRDQYYEDAMTGLIYLILAFILVFSLIILAMMFSVVENMGGPAMRLVWFALGAYFVYWVIYEVTSSRKRRWRFREPRGSSKAQSRRRARRLILHYLRQLDWRQEARQPLSIIMFLSAIIALSFALAASSGAHAADRVKTGKEVSIGGGFGALGVIGQPASLSNLPPTVDLSNKQLMYLGRSGQVIVVYDVSCKRPLRIPADGVVITILPRISTPLAACQNK
jgi:hypothetical protein